MTEDQPARGFPSDPEEDPSDLATQAESAAMRGIAALEDALAGWERYEVLGFLAQGGMGRVYKARDPRLGRLVALKFIVSDSFAAAQRFSQEAQAQARVAHEAVCRIYEVGVWSGQPYIALQYIDGLPLGEAARGLSVEEKAGLVRRVAEGLHAAHRLGLIHRDIKTSNIMVERGQDGLLHPYLMDFGLARAQEGPGLTQTGLIMGTPAFMAPEQARGDAGAVDRRSDIYSLGATLYEVLTGRLPFDARTSADVIVAILTEDPSPLRRLVPGLPQDLESIALKCLEKDPARRYDSAQALADDLGRFLDGLPVQARQIGPLDRLERRVRRNPAASALVVGSAVLALGFGAWGLRTSLRAKTQAALAQSFGQEAEQIDAILRYGHLLPLHDLRTEKAMVRERMAAIAARMAKAGSVAEAPGRAALGRGHLALGELAWARRELERAWALGHRSPEAEHALGRALAGLYQQALAEARKLPDPAARARRKQALVAELRDPALRHLQAGRSLSGISAYTEGLMALQEERFEEALGKARAAAGQLPWFYEAVALEGQIWGAQALTEAERGEYARALDSSRKAQEAFDRAFATARSDDALLLGKASAILVELAVASDQGRPMDAPFLRAQAVLAEARKVDPDRAENHHLEARIQWLRASDLDNSGRDGREALKASIQAAETALRLDPEDTQAYERLANACWYLSQQETGRGGDGAPALAKAEAAAKRGLALDASAWGLHRSLGVVHGIRAEARFRQGQDPAPELEASVAAFREALARNPEGTQICGNLANALFLVAEMKGDRGEDPQPALREAEAAVARALALNPELADSWDERGKLRFRQALHHFEHGQDPRPDLEAALSHLDAALKRNPGMPQAWVHRAEALLLKAQYQRETGLDPGQSLAEAEKASRRAREIIRDYGEIVAAFVDILLLKADLLAERGLACNPVLAEARQALEAAVARDATSPFMWERCAAIDLLAAKLAGVGVRPLLDTAERFLAKAESLGTPTTARRNLRARLSLAKARQAPGEAGNALAEGLSALDLSLKANPSQAEGRALRAALLMARARRNPDGAGGARDREAARTEYEAALKANPLLRREAGAWMAEAPLPVRAPRS